MTYANLDPYNLGRFLSAQSDDYEIALQELQRGSKESHWIWYIFPQVAGLGSSSMAQEYAIQSREEALAYLHHEILGTRLTTCANALLQVEGKSIEEIMGFPDDLKLKSSMTLFAAISPPDSIFRHLSCDVRRGMLDYERRIRFAYIL